jgi:antitoxin HicB
MNMLAYPVTLEPDTNGTILAQIADIPEAHTFGDDESEALARAAGALEAALSAYMDLRREIPLPSKPERGQRLVSLPVLSEAKVRLYYSMRSAKVGKAELARRLGCHMPQIDRLLDLNHTSRIGQVEAAFRALDKQIVIDVRDRAA